MATAYPEVITRLLAAIAEYRTGEVDLEQLKSSIWEASRVISSPDERGVCELLQRTEGRIDSIQFTVDPEQIDGEVAAVLVTLEQRLRQTLSD